MECLWEQASWQSKLLWAVWITGVTVVAAEHRYIRNVSTTQMHWNHQRQTGSRRSWSDRWDSVNQYPNPLAGMGYFVVE